MPLFQDEQYAEETTPLLGECDSDGLTFKAESTSSREMFWEELRMLPQYVWPVLGFLYFFLLLSSTLIISMDIYNRAQWLEHGMIAVNLISIGHLSTTALAAVSLGTMTANVTGTSVLQGLASGLDTVLPAAFTSPQPQLVGLWAQRMGTFTVLILYQSPNDVVQALS